jgi:hypothetical protein
MSSHEEDEEREERIAMEIIADAYDAEEQALGWWSYLSSKLQFPFSARCIKRRATSPLQPGDKVKVVDMAPEEECLHEMYVTIQWKLYRFAVPLMQLEGVQTDEGTQEAIEDWHYWVDQGNEL